jgi:hypothetical protein
MQPPAPNPPAASQAPSFDAVACPTLSRCLAVGDYGNATHDRVTLAEQWLA